MQPRMTRSVGAALLALFVLNSALSMTNWWPTPYVKLDARIAPEFVYVWCAVLVWVLAAQRGIVATISKRSVTLLALCYFLLKLFRKGFSSVTDLA